MIRRNHNQNVGKLQARTSIFHERVYDILHNKDDLHDFGNALMVWHNGTGSAIHKVADLFIHKRIDVLSHPTGRQMVKKALDELERKLNSPDLDKNDKIALKKIIFTLEFSYDQFDKNQLAGF